MHWNRPPWHAYVPGVHTPMLTPHASPIFPSGGGSGFAEPSIPSGAAPTSSTWPSQSLSRPSHSSGFRPTPPTHVPGAGRFGLWRTQPAAPAHASEPWLHGAESEPLPLHAAPGGGHHERFAKVQQAPGLFQQPFCPGGGPSASGGSSGTPSQ